MSSRVLSRSLTIIIKPMLIISVLYLLLPQQIVMGKFIKRISSCTSVIKLQVYAYFDAQLETNGILICVFLKMKILILVIVYPLFTFAEYITIDNEYHHMGHQISVEYYQ